MRLALGCVVLAIAALPVDARAECTVDRDAFKCPDWNVELFAPLDWELSAQPAYPGVLVSGVHRTGRARMTLAVQKLEPNETAKTYADRNRLALKKVGFRVGELAAHPSGAYLVDATSPDKSRRIRQGYRVHGDVAYILTVGAPSSSLRSYFRAFDDTLRSLRFDEIAPATPAETETDAEPTAETTEAPAEPPASNPSTPTPTPTPTP
jgi:hypothetical protein